MGISFNGKPLILTKTALDELSDIDFEPDRVAEILERGFVVRKRARGVIEKGMIRGGKVINMVVVDHGSCYTLIHAGEFTLTRKFRKLAGDTHGS